MDLKSTKIFINIAVIIIIRHAKLITYYKSIELCSIHIIYYRIYLYNIIYEPEIFIHTEKHRTGDKLFLTLTVVFNKQHWRVL